MGKRNLPYIFACTSDGDIRHLGLKNQRRTNPIENGQPTTDNRPIPVIDRLSVVSLQFEIENDKTRSSTSTVVFDFRSIIHSPAGKIGGRWLHAPSGLRVIRRLDTHHVALVASLLTRSRQRAHCRLLRTQRTQ